MVRCLTCTHTSVTRPFNSGKIMILSQDNLIVYRIGSIQVNQMVSRG